MYECQYINMQYCQGQEIFPELTEIIAIACFLQNFLIFAINVSLGKNHVVCMFPMEFTNQICSFFYNKSEIR